jgi:ankyrin repeat protein
MFAIALSAVLWLPPCTPGTTIQATRQTVVDAPQEHWPRDDTYGFPVWVALKATRGPTGVVFLLIEAHDFTEGNLRKVFAGFASTTEDPVSLQITAFSDRAMLQRAVDNFERPIFIDFASTPKGLEGQRKWREKNEPLPKGYFRAYYSRAADEESFKYSPDPNREGYVTVDLKNKRPPQPQTNKSADINERLLAAAAEGDAVEVRELLAKGADVNYKVEGQRTPLASAALYGNIDIVATLLKAGANVNQPSGGYGEPPLMLACGEGHLEVVKALLEAGADPNGKSVDGRVALTEAAMNGHTGVVSALLRAGAAVNTKDSEGKTALMLADDSRELVVMLIRAGAEVDALDKVGRTALLYAVVMNQPEKLQALIESGSNVNAKMKDGMTALTTAEQYGFKRISEILRSAGGAK